MRNSVNWSVMLLLGGILLGIIACGGAYKGDSTEGKSAPQSKEMNNRSGKNKDSYFESSTKYEDHKQQSTGAMDPLNTLMDSDDSMPSFQPDSKKEANARPEPGKATLVDNKADAQPKEPLVDSPERSIIYELHASLKVDERESAEQKVMDYVRSKQGYLVSSNEESLVMRIPAAEFAPFIEKLRDFGAIINKSITSADVTDQMTDLKIQLENQMAIRKRLLEFLDMAKNVEEALSVSQQLDEVELEINRIKGLLKSLHTRIGYSLIHITWTLKSMVQPEVREHDSPLQYSWLRTMGLGRLFSW